MKSRVVCLLGESGRFQVRSVDWTIWMTFSLTAFPCKTFPLLATIKIADSAAVKSKMAKTAAEGQQTFTLKPASLASLCCSSVFSPQSAAPTPCLRVRLLLLSVLDHNDTHIVVDRYECRDIITEPEPSRVALSWAQASDQNDLRLTADAVSQTGDWFMKDTFASRPTWFFLENRYGSLRSNKCQSVSRSTCLPLCRFVALSVRLSVRLSVCRSVSLPIYYLSICLYAWQAVCQCCLYVSLHTLYARFRLEYCSRWGYSQCDFSLSCLISSA